MSFWYVCTEHWTITCPPLTLQSVSLSAPASFAQIFLTFIYEICLILVLTDGTQHQCALKCSLKLFVGWTKPARKLDSIHQKGQTQMFFSSLSWFGWWIWKYFTCCYRSWYQILCVKSKIILVIYWMMNSKWHWILYLCKTYKRMILVQRCLSCNRKCT